jgi:hypothetical protein
MKPYDGALCPNASVNRTTSADGKQNILNPLQ